MKLNIPILLSATRRYFGIVDKQPPLVESNLSTQIVVASVLESAGRFLMIEKEVGEVLFLNQPAGRLEVGETAIEAAVRETFEESGIRFVPQYLVGIYDWRSAMHATRFLLLAYTGIISELGDGLPHDPDITRVTWLTHAQTMAQATRHRSPFVLACMEDYLRGARYPLGLVRRIHSQ